MAQALTSFSTAAISSQKPYHVFINHRGVDVKKTLASHIYHRLSSARTGTGLRVFLDQPELRVGCNFDFQIKDAIRTAAVHVAIFSPRYAESEWCLNELLYMLESKSLIIPVFYHVEPFVVRWPEGKGVYAQALRILEMKKLPDGTPRHDPATIKKWREALSTVSIISGVDLDAAPFHGDEGALVEKIVQRVLQEIKSRLEFNQSQKYGGRGGSEWFDGTHSGVTRIIMTANEYSLTSVQLIYAKEGNESSRYTYFPALQHGGVAGPPHHGVLGDRIEYSVNYPEENLTKISGHFGSLPFWPESFIVIKSLTFHTNKGKYGPCGQEEGTPFETEEGGTIVGFFGSSGTLLDSIGVYMLKPITWNREARQNGENEDDQIMPAVISAEDEASENAENKVDQIMTAPISAEDEASENAENKDDQIMPASISAEDEASENAENKDDQIMHAFISAEDEASENAENKDDQINCLPRENILGSLNRSVKLKSCLCNFRSIRITRKWIWNKVMFKCCRV